MLDKNTDFLEGEILLFNKPLYWTSFDLVGKVRNLIRKAYDIKKIKVGHAGTLDPLASGLMIICTGKATKKISELQNHDKEYIATFCLGATTPSFDLETEIDARHDTSEINKEAVVEALASFIGEQQQVPPIYSAKNIDGKRAYEYARKGIDIKMEPKTVYFRSIELVDFSMPHVKVKMLCSKGTYIRSFARDLGVKLGCGAHLSSLERTIVGKYSVDNAMVIEDFEKMLNTMKQNEV
jgi:tRNA pseudouridine55 synthase